MELWIFIIGVFTFILHQHKGDATLLEARQHEICSYVADENGFRFDIEPNCFLRNLANAVAVAIDVRDKLLFFSDIAENVTYKVDIQRTPPKKERILYGWGSIEGIAVDWMAENIFWTDSGLQHVAVSRYDGSHRHIVIFEDIGKPKGIAVSPSKGYLFWSDISTASKIERSDMTGHNRVVLIGYSLLSPNGLTVDHHLERLYFVDSGNDNVEYTDFTGRGRTLIRHEFGGNFFNVAFIKNFLFTTSFTSGLEVGVISSIEHPRDGASSDFMYRLVTHSGYSFGLTVNDTDAQPGTIGACGVLNGGCEQLCLPVDGSTFQCACGTGFTLKNDQRTCSSDILVEPFILVGDSSLNRIIQIDAKVAYSSYSALPLQDTMSPTGIAYDPKEAKIYWTDGELDQVSRSNLDGTEQEVIASDNIGEPAGIAIDPVRRQLFWTDEAKNIIERANLDGSRREVYVSSGLDQPRGITVNFINGDLFWTDWGTEPKIERISEGRTNRVVLVSTGLHRPNGIVIDPQANLLYWCDASDWRNSRIEVSGMDGEGRRILTNLSSSSHPFGLTIYGDLLYYTDWQMNALLAVDRFAKSPRPHHFGPKIFMHMHGIASSYFVEPEFNLDRVTMAPPVASSNGAEDEPSSVELPVIIMAGGGAFLLVFVCFTIALFFYRQKSKARTRTRSRRLSRQPNIPIPPTPIQNGAAAPISTKTIDLPDDNPDPFTGEHLYMDLDQLTVYHSQAAPPPYSPPRPIRDPTSFDNPSPKRRGRHSGGTDSYHCYYQNNLKPGLLNPRPDSIHDTYYIDPLGETGGEDQASIAPTGPGSDYANTDYMDLSESANSSNKDRLRGKRKPRHSVPIDYIKLKSEDPSESFMSLKSKGPPQDDQYMDPLSSQESQRVRRENARISQTETTFKKPTYPTSRYNMH